MFRLIVKSRLPKVEPVVIEEFDEPNFTIPPENEIVINPKVMFSTEIATLTGKLHKNLIRDIDEIGVDARNGANTPLRNFE